MLSVNSLARSLQKTSEKPAQCSTYSVRRIEIVGNTHTSDDALMRRIAFRIGKAFTERDIERTIKNLNRFGGVEKVMRQDISIEYGVNDAETPDWHCFADVLIEVKEKKRKKL